MPDLAPPPEQVRELMNVISKGIRALQLYLPNNPVYQRAVDNIRGAFRQVFQSTNEFILDVSETDLRWEDTIVYAQANRSESIAWTLYKDGVRTVTFKTGVEADEIIRFLNVLQHAKNLHADAPEDLLTLLWSEDFQYLHYTFRELISEDAAPMEKSATVAPPSPNDVRAAVEQEAPPRPEGLVSVDDFDTTLYFLEEHEVDFLRREIEREYGQDLRRNVLSMVFDLLELQTYSTVRAELLSIIENFIPYLLGAGDFRSVAFVLREVRSVLERARELIPEQREALETVPARLSQAAALSQLLQSLDEAAMHPTEQELGDLFQELRPEALLTLLAWMPRLTNERVRELVQRSAERLALNHGAEVLKALASADPAVQIETVKLAGRLKLPGAPEGMGHLMETGDREVKLALVDALTQIATPSAMRVLERAVDDDARDVRIAAVRFIAQRGHRNAFPRIESMVTGGKMNDADLTEKIAFFEAFGALGGAPVVPALEKLLVVKGLLSKKADPETRACAAMALGKIRAPAARETLERVRDDKDALVRNAVSRALREGAA
jgi:hypothetical protein